MATYEDILSGKNLTGLIQGVKTGVPSRVPEAFVTPTRAVTGNTASYRRVEGNRQLARLAQYGSKAHTRGLAGISETPVTLMHSFESQSLPAEVMQNLVASDGERQAMARGEIERQARHFKSLFSNLRLSAVQMALATGRLHFDDEGQLLPSATGAFFSIDFGVAESHRGQLDVFGDGAIIDTAWSNAAAPIVAHIRAIKQAAIKESGYDLRYAFYGADIVKHLANNTEASKFLNGSSDMTDRMAATGEIPSGFLGLEWRPMADLFYADAEGALQEMLPADSIVFTPEPSPDWYELYEGSYVIPASMGNVREDAMTSVEDLSQVYGQFSYAVVEHNPVSIQMYAGDTFLPLIKAPNAVFIADVTP